MDYNEITIDEIELLFESLKETLSEKSFNAYVDAFWSSFSHNA